MTKRLTYALVAALALNAACADELAPPVDASTDSAPATVTRGGWLHLALSTDLRSLDPAVAFDASASAIEDLVYATLVELSPDGRTVAPGLAASWEQSEDTLRYVFHLRPALLFHDGSPLHARDVKRSIERALHPDTPCPGASFYARIRGYDAYEARTATTLDGVRVEGEDTLAIELREPDAAFLSALALPLLAAVCPSAGDRYTPAFSALACGAGPFRVRAWDAGRRLDLERFDGYFRPGLPYVDGVSWSLLVPSFTQRLLFERAEIDLVRELSYSDGWLFRRDRRWGERVAWEPGRETRAVFMNTEMAPFQNSELRRAVSAAIDRDQIAALRPQALRPATRVLPPAVPGYDARPGQRFDYAAALSHMRAAGYPYDPAKGTGGYPHELDFVTPGGPTLGSAVAQVIQQQLARVGIRMRIRQLGYLAYLTETSRRRTTTFGSDSWAVDVPDPSTFYESLFSRASIADEGSQNRSFYANPRLDALLDEARREPMWGRRQTLYASAEAIIDNDAPWAMAYRYDWFELWHPYLRGYAVHPLITPQVRFAWIAPHHEPRTHNPSAWRSPLAALSRLFAP